MSGEPTVVGTLDPITIYRRTLKPEGRILAATLGKRCLNHPSLWGHWHEDGTAHAFPDGSILGWVHTPVETSSSYRLAHADGSTIFATSVHLCDPHGNVIEIHLTGGDE